LLVAIGKWASLATVRKNFGERKPMSAFWQAKIWGLLHDPALKALRHARDLGDEGAWKHLECMTGWISPKEKGSDRQGLLNGEWLKHVGRCDLLASASDRSTIGRMPPEHSAVTYGEKGLEICHLLSGESQFLALKSWQEDLQKTGRQNFLKQEEEACIPDSIRTCSDARKVFWWFWRCYPEVLSKQSPEVQLLPAETRLPDGSLWSHTSMTSALAGALAGYYDKPQDYPQKGQKFKGRESRPHIASFTFTPIQELIKASRKLRDLWAGSWLLHYLSARACWKIAWKYGPDTLIYPCLYAQPLIDHWLLQEYNDFGEWIEHPSDKSLDALLTAGFPNVLVMLLPDNAQSSDAFSGNPVKSAMQQTNDSLKAEWRLIGNKVLQWLQNESDESEWKKIYPKLWSSWLESQWQTYWVALPLGDRAADLHQSLRSPDQFKQWAEAQNNFARPGENLFLDSEITFLKAVFGIDNADADEESKEIDDQAAETTQKTVRLKQPNLNVGSWWASIFDQVRYSLTSVKSARTWSLPTAFGPRSTISGIGSVLHPVYNPARPDWATEGETQHFWKNHARLFDGREELNATEVLKRGLHQVLLDVLGLRTESNNAKVLVLYPDLSSGVAGWVRLLEARSQQGDQDATDAIAHYKTACKEILEQFAWSEKLKNAAWGIPWIDKHHRNLPNPRLLNAGWLIEEYEGEETQAELSKVKTAIQQSFSPGNNPTDWYVLAAGDGDGMSQWLKGMPLKSYQEYIPEALKLKLEKLPELYNGQIFRKVVQDFLEVKKRMGPATHSALSRALLDFSNQLVPYLTEQRYAGRLIYSGGDDVLTYTNLWEWDRWLWDIRECFRGSRDPKGRTETPMQEEDDLDNEFICQGDYWTWKAGLPPENVAARPLFTMGGTATISFGVVIANQGVPLAIALDNLREAEEAAKEHFCSHLEKGKRKKNAVQVRVLYGNGNILQATAKFEAFAKWRVLLSCLPGIEPALFEQAAQLWEQHPVPIEGAIKSWTQAFAIAEKLSHKRIENKHFRLL
jgi:CRISPR-associated protein Cmr2